MCRFRNLAHYAHNLPPKEIEGRKISGKEVDNRWKKEEEGTEECISWIAACTVSAARHNEQAEPHTQVAY